MTTPTETRVHEIIQALLVVAAGIDGVHALDGPEVNTTDVNDCIAIGVGDPAVIVQQRRLDGYGDDYLEIVNVVCAAWSWSGSVEFSARRSRVADILGDLRIALRDDPKLGGVCERAILGEAQEWQQGVENEGAAVSVGFTIRAETYT